MMKEETKKQTVLAFQALQEVFVLKPGETLPVDVEDMVYSHPPYKRAALARAIRVIAAQMVRRYGPHEHLQIGGGVVRVEGGQGSVSAFTHEDGGPWVDAGSTLAKAPWTSVRDIMDKDG
jgi:hypothetical protein